MDTVKTKKIEIIESLRGFASIYIVIHHFLGFTALKQKVPEVLHFPFRFGQEVVGKFLKLHRQKDYEFLVKILSHIPTTVKCSIY